MFTPEGLRALLAYNDRSDLALLGAARPLPDEALDRAFDMGRGTLRLTLVHIHAGEDVWRQRISGRVETPWPDERAPTTISELEHRFRETWRLRDELLRDVARWPPTTPQRYRDSRGSLFETTTADMLAQLVLHAHHHRAQAANMLRHLGAGTVELDYMYGARKPASGT